MSLVTATFSDVEHARKAYSDLHGAGFRHMGFFTSNAAKGTVLSQEIRRDFVVDGAPQDEAFSDKLIYGRLPDRFGEYTSRPDMHSDTMGWAQEQLNAGNILLVVDAEDRVNDAYALLGRHEAMLFGGRPAAHAMPTRGEGEIHMPIMEEEVAVEKTTHQFGEVEIRPEVTTRRVDIPQVLTHEEIRVERRTLERPLSPDEYHATTTQEGVIRVPLVEEEVRVTKRPVIREELVVTRVPVNQEQVLHEEVRHSEPHIETKGDVVIRNEEPPERKRPAA
jgi:uncharacterized protein (TIGR02271 family)